MSRDDSVLAGAEILGLPLQADQAESLLTFVELLRTTNAAMNLVSRRDVRRLETRHVLDSLAVAAWMKQSVVEVETGELLDIGSGGGFPGLVLAIVFRRARVLLVDRSAKKVRFLQRAVDALRLANVEARCHDVGRAVLEARFNVITSRAVAPVEQMWPWVRPLLVRDGLFIHMSHAATGIHPVSREFEAGESSSVVLRVPGLKASHGLTTVLKVEKQ